MLSFSLENCLLYKINLQCTETCSYKYVYLVHEHFNLIKYNLFYYHRPMEYISGWLSANIWDSFCARHVREKFVSELNEQCKGSGMN